MAFTTHLSAGDGDKGWRFALDASSVDEQILLEHGELVSGRGLMQNDRADASVGGHALAMLAWHEKNMFSGVSGSPTEPIEAGLKRTGPVHLAYLYPVLPAALLLPQEIQAALTPRDACLPRAAASVSIPASTSR